VGLLGSGRIVKHPSQMAESLVMDYCIEHVFGDVVGVKQRDSTDRGCLEDNIAHRW